LVELKEEMLDLLHDQWLVASGVVGLQWFGFQLQAWWVPQSSPSVFRQSQVVAHCWWCFACDLVLLVALLVLMLVLLAGQWWDWAQLLARKTTPAVERWAFDLQRSCSVVLLKLDVEVWAEAWPALVTALVQLLVASAAPAAAFPAVAALAAAAMWTPFRANIAVRCFQVLQWLSLQGLLAVGLKSFWLVSALSSARG